MEPGEKKGSCPHCGEPFVWNGIQKWWQCSSNKEFVLLDGSKALEPLPKRPFGTARMRDGSFKSWFEIEEDLRNGRTPE